MNIAIEKQDATVLAFCMDIMKKNCKEKLRANLGIREGKVKYKVYKGILKVLEEELMNNQELSDRGFLSFEFNQEQSEVSREFISSFMQRLEEEAEKEGQLVEEVPYYNPLNDVLLAFLVAESYEMAVV